MRYRHGDAGKQLWGLPMRSRGFTLIELTLMVGIFGLLTMGIMALLQNGITSASTIERNSNVADSVNELRRILGKSSVCTPNFKDKIMAEIGQPGLQIDGLHLYDPAGVKGEPIVMANVAKGSIIPKEISLKIRQRINSFSAVADLTFKYQGAKEVWGKFEVERRVPLFVSTVANSNKIIACSDLSEDGPVLYEKICDVSGNGRDYFNPSTGKCESRFETKCQGQGSFESASCEVGWNLVPNQYGEQCNVRAPAGYDDTAGKSMRVTRTYSRGRIQMSNPPAAYCEPTGQTVDCFYASGVNAAGFTCEACCEKQVVF